MLQLLLMLGVDQGHICSAHRHKELWEHGRIEVQGHGLKAHTQLSLASTVMDYNN
jgi:hypothetical protein